MSSTSATVSKWSRRYVLTGFAFLVLWQVGVLAGIPHRTHVSVGLLGFVFHVVFGKGYSLIPVYFDRELVSGWAPAVQYPLTAGGVALLTIGSIRPLEWAMAVGATGWGLGVLTFAVAIGATIRTNPIGRATGTGAHNRHRQGVDRLANLFIPLALLYLLVGTYELVAGITGVAPLLDGFGPQAAHLIGAGTATLLLFAIGFRLLPRFLVATPPRGLVWVVLPAGGLGPALIAGGLGSTGTLPLGAALQAIAIVGFALAYGSLFHQSDRRRVGFYGVYAGVIAGVLAAGAGLWVAFGGGTAPVVEVHIRSMLLGFLGLSIIGVTYQFYPPAVGAISWADDRLAAVSIAAIFVGLLLEGLGNVAGMMALAQAGTGVVFAGSVLVFLIVVSVFWARAER